MSNVLLQSALNTLVSNYLPNREPLKADGLIGKKTRQAFDVLRKVTETVHIRKNYPLNEKGRLCAIRMKTNRVYKFSNRFVDVGIVTLGDNEECFPMSTVAGLYGAGNVLQPSWIDGVYGVGVVKEGFYPKAYQLNSAWWSGLKFLRQIADFEYYRDGNLDTSLDRGKVYKGKKGFNFHSWLGFTGQWVNNLSQGCMVTEEVVYESVVLPYFEQLAVIYNNEIDFCLLNEDDFIL